MALRKSKIYKLIANGTREALVKGMMEYLRSGKSPNLKDPETGGNLLHHIVDHQERFGDPETLSIVYMLACKDVEIDAQDINGDTCLHKVVRVKGAYRLLIAFMRIGIDTGLTNNEGFTAEDILLKQKSDDWQTNLYFYNKYKPGLWRALQEDEPDRKLIERLLKSWCRVTSVKDGKVTEFKSLLMNDVRKTDIIMLIEKYENSIELALALIGGVGFEVRMWLEQGIIQNVDPNFMDISHEELHPQRTVAPRPLLVCTWETNSLSAVDVLMELKADPNLLCSPNPATLPFQPLFFHLLDSQNRPRDIKIIERILKDCDFTHRNCEGQTILFPLIKRKEPEFLFKLALSKNVNLAARDRLGRTARDYAEEHGVLNCRKMIDEQIFRLIKTKQLDIIEKLVIESYDHLHDIKDCSGKTTTEYAKRHSTKQVEDIIRLSQEVQNYCQRTFQSVVENNMEDLQKLLYCRKYAATKEKCGKTVLLKALMLQQKEMVLYLIREFDFIVNECDNLGRSPLHYSYLFMEESEVIEELIKHGANKESPDVKGVKAADYSRKVCGREEFNNRKKQVEDFHLDIYIHETKFDSKFHKAIEEGDFESIRILVTDAKPHGDLSRYSTVLFTCIDNNRQDIAEFLIDNDFKTDIYKQYNKCEPSNPMCAMMECGHAMTSLYERANQKNCLRVSERIEDLKKRQK